MEGESTPELQDMDDPEFWDSYMKWLHEDTTNDNDERGAGDEKKIEASSN